LARSENSDQHAVCVDEDSGLVVSALDPAGHDFFERDGTLSPATKSMVDLLQQIERSRAATIPVISALAAAGVVQHWPLQVTVDGQPKPLNGLYRIDEAALAALDDETFLQLRKCGALPLAYLQMVSIQQVASFQNLARLQVQLPESKVPST